MMALTSVTAAALMKGQPEVLRGRRSSSASSCSGSPSARSTGRWSSSRRSRTSSSPWRCRSSGPARPCWSCNTPGGGSADWLKGLVSRARSAATGSRAPSSRWSSIVGVIWIPLRRSTTGLALYARGQRPPGRVPERRLGRSDQGLRLCPDRPVLGVRRPGPDRDAPGSAPRSRVPTPSSGSRPSSSAASASPAAGAASRGRSSRSSSWPSSGRT